MVVAPQTVRVLNELRLLRPTREASPRLTPQALLYLNAGCDAQLQARRVMRVSAATGLPPVEPLQPEQIKRIRETTRVSQAVFGRLLNSSLSTVQKWEIGQKWPTGTALKLLHLVQQRGIDVVA